MFIFPLDSIALVRKSFYSVAHVRLDSFNDIVLSYGKEDGGTLCLFKIAETKSLE
jgi:hypothetical protein